MSNLNDALTDDQWVAFAEIAVEFLKDVQSGGRQPLFKRKVEAGKNILFAFQSECLRRPGLATKARQLLPAIQQAIKSKAPVGRAL